MRRRMLFVSMLVCLFVWFVPTVLAAGDVTVVGTVGGATPPPAGTTIVFHNTATDKDVVTQVVNPMGEYRVSLPQGTYDIIIKPPTESSMQPITEKSIPIASNTVKNITTPSSVNPMSSTIPVRKNLNSEEVFVLVGAMAVLIAAGIGVIVWRRR